jgi:cation:H+ antiporter
MLFIVFSLYSVKKKINLGEIRLEEELVKLLRFKFTFGLKKTLFLFTAGIILTMISSKFVVDSASNIASMFGIAGSIIGATIIAVGTSLPELSTSLNAVRENHLRLGLGNTIGSCLTNLTLVLGFILLVSPYSINMDVYSTLLVFVLISTILLWIFLGGYGRKKLERIEGVILLIVFVIFLIMIYYFPISSLG